MAKVMLRITASYIPEKRDGFTVVEAHYEAHAVLENGWAVTGAGLTHYRAISELESAAAKALGHRDTLGIGWEWNTDGGRTGREAFPADVEARVVCELEKEAKQLAARKAQQAELQAVAEAIMRMAPPFGYTWRVEAPRDSWDVGSRLYLYADKEDAHHYLSIVRKARGGHWGVEVWIEGPGYGAERSRCKANGKGAWAAKAREMVLEYIDRLDDAAARDAKAVEAGKAAAARVADFCVTSNIPGPSVQLGDYRDGSISINAVRESGNVDLSATNVVLLPGDAIVLIAFTREAHARRVAADKAAREASAPAATQQGQGAEQK